MQIVGVEDVTADYKASKVIVKGKTADPMKVCQRIQKKSGRKVELISPLPKPPPEDNKEENKEPPTPPPPQDNNKEQVFLFSFFFLHFPSIHGFVLYLQNKQIKSH